MLPSLYKRKALESQNKTLAAQLRRLHQEKTQTNQLKYNADRLNLQPKKCTDVYNLD